MTVRIALAQMCATRTPQRNLACLIDLVRQAVAAGASYILTPENTNLMERDRERLFALAEPDDGGVFAKTASDLAREHSVTIHLGSLAVRTNEDRLANRSMLFGADGQKLATYDKIHMFDVDLPGGESYRESDRFRPGDTAVVADVGPIRIGMTVCYDVRFPYLYQRLASAGANLLAVPSAFTRQTGEAHWHVLLRARAIETGCHVAAAAQCGQHENGRETYGHSVIVSPSGEIVADAGERIGVVVADLQLAT